MDVAFLPQRVTERQRGMDFPLEPTENATIRQSAQGEVCAPLPGEVAVAAWELLGRSLSDMNRAVRRQRGKCGNVQPHDPFDALF